MTNTTAKVETKTVNVIRYLGNDGDQYVMNRACYLCKSVVEMLKFDTFEQALAYALVCDKVVGGHEFEATTLRVF